MFGQLAFEATRVLISALCRRNAAEEPKLLARLAGTSSRVPMHKRPSSAAVCCRGGVARPRASPGDEIRFMKAPRNECRVVRERRRSRGRSRDAYRQETIDRSEQGARGHVGVLDY